MNDQNIVITVKQTNIGKKSAYVVLVNAILFNWELYYMLKETGLSKKNSAMSGWCHRVLIRDIYSANATSIFNFIYKRRWALENGDIYDSNLGMLK